MGKIFRLFLIFAFSFFIYACNEQNEEKTINLKDVFNSVFDDVDVTDVNSDLNLPQEKDGVEFIWTSDNKEVISDNGKVTPKEVDVTVKLTAVLKYEDKEEEFKIVLIVKKDDKVNKKDADAIFNEIIEAINLTNVTKDIVLPTEVEGALIEWQSSNPNVLSETGEVTPMGNDIKVTLSAKLTLNGEVYEYHFDVIVKKGSKYLSADKINEYNGTIKIDFRVPSGIISKTVETLVPEFEAKWNGKIDVDVDIEAGGYDGVRKTTIFDLNRKTAPTIVLGYADHFAEYYETGYLLNLQPYIDMEEDFNIDDFIKSYLDENRIVKDSNDLYGMPLNKSTEVLCYNETVFEYMGYKVPATWQEVETLGNQIISDVEAGKLDAVPGIEFARGEKSPSEYLAMGQFYPIAYDSTSNAFITMCKQWNAAYTEKYDVEYGYSVFNNPECKAGLAYFQNLAKNGLYALAETFNSDYTSDAFKLMKCVMTIGSNAGIGYNTNNKFEMSVAKVPYNAENQDGKYVIQQGTNMAILDQSDPYQKAAAWQLMKWLTSTEITAKFCIYAGGYVPVRKSAYEVSSYKEFLEYPAIDETDYSNSANVALSYINEGYQFFFEPAFVGASEVRSIVGMMMKEVVVDKKDITRAIEDALSKLGPSYQK